MTTAALAAIALLGEPSSHGQSRQTQLGAARPSFEVASVKPRDPGERTVSITISPGGRFSVKNITLRMLIEFAYRVQGYQISGGPGWLNSDKYNIDAKPESPINPKQDVRSDNQLRLMVQSLLADRFRLQLRTETEDLPIYALVVARDGPKMEEAKADGPGPMCRIAGRGGLACQKLTMALLADDLGRELGRPVRDHTGLTGRYDITLHWTPDFGEGMPFGGPGEPGGPGESDDPPADTDGPSIFTAVQEQLGLKLESGKGPVDVLIIEHVEKPSENQ